MHSFQLRLDQLLSSVDGLSEGRRQRLARPLRQADIRCWERPADETLDAALLACTRSLAHELLDSLALHLEAALAACQSTETGLLLAALAARETILGCEVRFRVDGRLLGCAFPTVTRLAIEPLPVGAPNHAVLRIEVSTNDSAADSHSLNVVIASAAPAETSAKPDGDVTDEPTLRLTAAQIAADPFAAAATIGLGWRESPIE